MDISASTNTSFEPSSIIALGDADSPNKNANLVDLGYAGTVTPTQAWAWFQAGQAVIVDVRTKEELHFVGYVPGALHVAWATGTALNRNPRFTRELETKVAKHQTVLLLCRSGKRSAEAAIAATKTGFTQVYNIEQGFEGDLNAAQQRGQIGGWRLAGLPWEQD